MGSREAGDRAVGWRGVRFQFRQSRNHQSLCVLTSASLLCHTISILITTTASPKNFSLDLVNLPTPSSDLWRRSADSWELLTPSIIAAAQSRTAQITSRDFLSFSNSVDFLSLSRTGSNPPSTSLQTTSINTPPRKISRSVLRATRGDSISSRRTSLFGPTSFLQRLHPSRGRSKSLSLLEIQLMPSKAASILGIDSTADYVQRGGVGRPHADDDDHDEDEERNSVHATTTSATTGRSFCFSRKSHQQNSGSTLPTSLGPERKLSTSDSIGGEVRGTGGRRWSNSLSNVLVRHRKSETTFERTTESPFPLVVQHILPPPPTNATATAKSKSKQPRLAKLFFSKPQPDLPSPLSSVPSLSSLRRISDAPPPSPTSSLASSSWRAPDSWLITPDDVEVLKCQRGRSVSFARERSGSSSVREREREEEELLRMVVVRSLRPV